MLIDAACEQAQPDEHDPYAYSPRWREFTHPEFREALLTVAGEGGAVNSYKLGRWLGKIKEKLVDGRQIIAAGVLDGIGRWKLVSTKLRREPAREQACAGAPRF
jgi:hypothetical protein